WLSREKPSVPRGTPRRALRGGDQPHGVDAAAGAHGSPLGCVRCARRAIVGGSCEVSRRLSCPPAPRKPPIEGRRRRLLGSAVWGPVVTCSLLPEAFERVPDAVALGCGARRGSPGSGPVAACLAQAARGQLANAALLPRARCEDRPIERHVGAGVPLLPYAEH